MRTCPIVKVDAVVPFRPLTLVLIRLRSLPAEGQLVGDPRDEELLDASLPSPLLLAVRGPCPLWVGFPLLKKLAG